MAEVIEETEFGTISLARTFKAPIERIFDAWTQPELLMKWFGPAGVKVLGAEVDLVAGGRYDFHMVTPEGDEVHHYGMYQEIVPNRKLVFTWVLDGQDCGGCKDTFVETIVTIVFREVTDGVEVTLTHTGLPTEASYEGHRFGWESSLESLAKNL